MSKSTTKPKMPKNVSYNRVPGKLWRMMKKHLPSDKRSGRGWPRASNQAVVSGIWFVLCTGCQWKALPQERFGSPSAIHTHFMRWMRAEFFVALWRAGLAEYDEMEGIAWSWQGIDGAMVKAPLALEAVGRNPTDRGKKRNQTTSPGGRPWCPVIARRDRSKPA